MRTSILHQDRPLSQMPRRFPAAKISYRVCWSLSPSFHHRLLLPPWSGRMHLCVCNVYRDLVLFQNGRGTCLLEKTCASGRRLPTLLSALFPDASAPPGGQIWTGPGFQRRPMPFSNSVRARCSLSDPSLRWDLRSVTASLGIRFLFQKKGQGRNGFFQLRHSQVSDLKLLCLELSG